MSTKLKTVRVGGDRRRVFPEGDRMPWGASNTCLSENFYSTGSTGTTALETQHFLLPKSAIPSFFPNFLSYAYFLTCSFSSPWFEWVRRHLRGGQSDHLSYSMGKRLRGCTFRTLARTLLPLTASFSTLAMTSSSTHCLSTNRGLAPFMCFSRSASISS